jgi:hypothetical protein
MCATHSTPGPSDRARGLLLRPWRAADTAAPVDAHRAAAVRRRPTAPLEDEAGARRWIDEQQEAACRGERFSLPVAEEGTVGPADQVVPRVRGPGHVLPPWPPQYPDPGHVRHRDG